MTEGFLFDRAVIDAGLLRLDEVLVERSLPRQRLVVVGGSYLALADLRHATRDIDTITRITDAIRLAIDAVASELGFPEGWLNDRAAAFAPIGLVEKSCSSAFEGTSLTVLLPSPDWVFLMKLFAGRAVDRSDLIRLWPIAGFSSPEEAVERYKDAYPHAPEDEYLVEYVADIAARAGFTQ